MIKTYRGILADGGQDKINLKTLKGEIGYRIVKFDIFAVSPGTLAQESTVMVWKLKQIISSPIPSSVYIDFTDSDLLGVASIHGWSDRQLAEAVVLFDQEVFNQDIYVTHTETVGTAACNYYLELEQIMLNENESTMATLQSLRRLSLPRN